MDFELNDDQKAFQDAARSFAKSELAPNAAQWDAQSVFPVEVIRQAGEMGFCGIYSPEQAGGMGAAWMPILFLSSWPWAAPLRRPTSLFTIWPPGW